MDERGEGRQENDKPFGGILSSVTQTPHFATMKSRPSSLRLPESVQLVGRVQLWSQTLAVWPQEILSFSVPRPPSLTRDTCLQVCGLNEIIHVTYLKQCLLAQWELSVNAGSRHRCYFTASSAAPSGA